MSFFCWGGGWFGHQLYILRSESKTIKYLAKPFWKCYWNIFVKFSQAFRTFYDDVISDVIASEILSQIDQKHPPLKTHEGYVVKSILFVG